MKNIFIEGLQGTGKSTFLRRMAKELPEYTVYYEGDLSPLELAWCSYMTPEEYDAALDRYPDLAEEIRRWTVDEDGRKVVAYTRILTEYEGFHRHMENYEIYNGRRELAEFCEIVRSRMARYGGTGTLSECAFLQNIVEELILFAQWSDDEIVQFYRDLFDVVAKEHFLLVYMDSEDIEANVEKIKGERCDEHGRPIWFELMLAYLKESPYGKTHGYETGEHLCEHMRHRRNVELRIVHEVLGDKAVILQAKRWTEEDVASLRATALQ